MKMRNKLVAFICMAFMVSAGAIGIATSESKVYHPTFATYTNHDADTYYEGIDGSLTGNSLLSALRSLNNKRRKSTIGYSGLGSQYKYTDYDTATVKYDGKGQPYSDNYVAFYSGEVRSGMNGMNKEHVWPDSRGGNLVEKDIHMPRPTLSSDNSSRGNSFFVEDVKSTSSGWDPKFANPSDITYRGDSARIVFYSVVASDQLSLIDDTNDNKNNKTMGKLSDLIKWHINYEPLEREMNRNEGAEYLQGNRNPFIDHPEYVCKIWGNTNDATKELCAKDPYAAKAPESITISNSELTVAQGKTKTLTVTTVSPEDASRDVSWKSSSNSVATVDSGGVVSGVTPGTATITATSIWDQTVTATCSVTVLEPSPVTMTGITPSIDKSTIFQSETAQISVDVLPEETYPMPTYTYAADKDGVVSINSTGLVTGLNPGTVNITVTATQGEVVKTGTVSIEVKEKASVSGSITITKDSFGSGNNYSWVSWNQDGISGEAFCYAPSLTSTIQITGANDKTGHSLSNTTEMPGDIMSVKVKGTSGKRASDWKLYADTKPISREDYSSTTIKDFEVKTVDTTEVTWTVPYTGLRYFALRINGTGAGFLDSVTVEYGNGSGGQETGKTLSSIEITHEPNKLEYTIGESFDLTGLQVMAKYSEGEPVDVTSKVRSSISGILNTEGTVTVQISYTEGNVVRIATFDIVVKASGGDDSGEETDPLAQAKTDAIASLRAYYESIDKTKYNKAGLDALESALNVGINNINSSTTQTEINDAVQRAKTVMDTVQVAQDTASKNGCGGNIATTSVILSSLALLGIALILVKKYKKHSI